MERSPEQIPGPSPEALAAGYEPSDIRLRGLLWFLVGMIVVGAVLHVGIWILQTRFMRADRLADEPRSAVADNQLPPAPRLQPSTWHDNLPYQDMDLLRSQEDGVFQKLGWDVNPRTHGVNMPPNIVERVQKTEASLADAARSQPTAGPRNANSIYTGPPTTQTTGGTAISPQGPAGGLRGDLMDLPTAEGSGGKSQPPREKKD